MVSKSDFVIENGTLIRYTGPGGDVVVPNGVIRIEGYFDGASTWWRGAFQGCKRLMSIVLPEGIQRIGDSAFDGCKKLTGITLPKSLQSIGKGAFYGCEGLTSITLPEGLRRIRSNAFHGCKGLTSVTLPESLQKVAYNAFYECNNLTIYAPAGSYAVEYAREEGIPLITEPRNFQKGASKESGTGTSKGIAAPSLSICPDCGGIVSRRASACPHCGCPISIILEG